MFYTITGKRLSGALVTQDGVVKRATANCEWACGERIGTVLAWANEQSMTWSVSDVVPAALVAVLCDGTGGRHASHQTRLDATRAERVVQPAGARGGGHNRPQGST